MSFVLTNPCQTSAANLQSRMTWTVVSWAALHLEHPEFAVICLWTRLLFVRRRSRLNSHKKCLMWGGSPFFQIRFQLASNKSKSSCVTLFYAVLTVNSPWELNFHIQTSTPSSWHGGWQKEILSKISWWKYSYRTDQFQLPSSFTKSMTQVWGWINIPGRRWLQSGPIEGTQSSWTKLTFDPFPILHLILSRTLFHILDKDATHKNTKAD